MWNFQGIVFIWIWMHGEIFKSPVPLRTPWLGKGGSKLFGIGRGTESSCFFWGGGAAEGIFAGGLIPHYMPCMSWNSNKLQVAVLNIKPWNFKILTALIITFYATGVSNQASWCFQPTFICTKLTIERLEQGVKTRYEICSKLTIKTLERCHLYEAASDLQLY